MFQYLTSARSCHPVLAQAFAKPVSHPAQVVLGLVTGPRPNIVLPRGRRLVMESLAAERRSQPGGSEQPPTVRFSPPQLSVSAPLTVGTAAVGITRRSIGIRRRLLSTGTEFGYAAGAGAALNSRRRGLGRRRASEATLFATQPSDASA